ncbi:MAG: hypothetical protein ACREH8_03945 [Opitutaceae bacterium]
MRRRLTVTKQACRKQHLQGERDSRNWNRAGRIVPTDFVTPWLNAGDIPGSGYTVSKPVYNNTSLAGIANNRIFAQAANAPLVIQDGVVPIRNWRDSVTVRTLIRELMRSLNERGLTLPDGSQRKLRFFLTLKEQIIVQIRSDPG